MKKVLFSATVDSHILAFHLPYLEYFKKMGYEVHVATNTDSEIPFCDKKHKISFERSPFKLNNIKAIFQMKKVLIKEKFNIIHCHTPMGSVVTRLAAKRTRKEGTKVIYTAHGFHFFKGAPLINWLLFYPVEKYLSKYTDTLITINKEDYELAQKKFKKTNIEYIAGVGINTEKFNVKMTKQDKTKLRREIGLSENDFVIIYPAELNKNKNQKFLIECMEQLVKKHNNIHLILPGKDSYDGYHKEMVNKNNLDKNIHFLGFRKDIPHLLKICDLSISSSLREGLPVNVMEAMCCGLPVVALDCRGIRDLVDDEVNGFVIDKNDKIKFIDAILDIYENKKDVSGIKKSNVDKSKQYCIENILNKYVDIYNKKRVIYLRSTSIVNDSRATKEINTYANNNCDVLVLGWNRQNLEVVSSNININYDLYNKKSEYGKGIKNIFSLTMFQLWLYFKLKKYRNKYDIIHACDFDTAYISSKIAKKYNKKFIYDIYDYYVHCHSLSFLSSFIEKLDIKTINKADIVIICTEQRKKQISKCNPKNICIVHNSPKITKEVEKTKFNPKKIKVCYVGILQDDRLLIEISKKITKEKNIEFHIGGFGKYEDYFKKLAKENINIKFYGQMKYEDVLNLESNCDILFATYNPKVPNHKFSAPNKVYEAMALGKPIIVCKDTGVDEIVKKENIGFVIDYNADDFIKIIKEITDKNYDLISKKGIELYKNKYSWDSMEKEILKNIEE